MENINVLMSELAKYTRIQEETQVIIDGLKDEIKLYMTENKLEILTGTEHKASYKTVSSTRLDTTALKKDLPEIAIKYSKVTTTKRFTFS